MNRREVVLVLLAAGAALLGAIAQTERRVRRIGFLSLANTQVSLTGPLYPYQLEFSWSEVEDYLIKNALFWEMPIWKLQWAVTYPRSRFQSPEASRRLLRHGFGLLPG